MDTSIQIAECPSCHKAIYQGHRYPWCVECGERFSERFLSTHPEVYTSKPYTGPKTEGPSEATSSLIVGYGLLVVGVTMLITPLFWHPNYSAEDTFLNMAPNAVICLGSGWKYLHYKKSKQRNNTPLA